MNNHELGRRRDHDILRFIEDFNTITIQQCADYIYPTAASRYKIAERKLNKLVKAKRIKVDQTETKENIYYFDKKLSYHDLLINSFYIALVNSGATNIKMEKRKIWLDDKFRSDALLSYDYGKWTFYNILEVCWSHKNIPIKEYEELYYSGEAHQICNGTFPRVIVVDDIIHKDNRFKSEVLPIYQLDFTFNTIPQIFMD
jgi:hypothetical protein